MQQVLAIAKALSDENRLRALIAIRGDELCLCQLIHVLGLSPATVSKHMDTLERAGLVERRREGKWRFYRLAGGPGNCSAMRALEWALEALHGDPRIAEDARKIAEVRRRDLEELSACYRG